MDPDGWLTCLAVGELSTSSAVTSNEGVLMGCENVATHWVCGLAVNGQRDPEGTCTPVVTLVVKALERGFIPQLSELAVRRRPQSRRSCRGTGILLSDGVLLHVGKSTDEPPWRGAKPVWIAIHYHV